VTTASPLQASQSELEQELAFALEQQAATSAILRSISSSPTDLQLVLMAVAKNAARLCNADVSQILRIDGDFLRLVASYGPIPSRLRGEAIRINRNSVSGRAVVDRQAIHVHDLLAELDTEFPDAKPYSKLWGHRTTLATPLLRQGVPIGVIFIRRTEVRPFSDKHIEVLKTFADKAAIAIENVRLFQCSLVIRCAARRARLPWHGRPYNSQISLESPAIPSLRSWSGPDSALSSLFHS